MATISAVHFTPFGELSGAQRSLLTLAGEQAKHQPTGVWVPFENGVSREARSLNAAVWVFPLRLGAFGLAHSLIRGAFGIRRFAGKLDARILHCHTAHGMKWAWYLARASGLKLVCHQRDNYLNDDYHRWLERADGIIANSRAVFATLPPQLQARTTVVHNATRLPELPPPKTESRRLRIGMAGRSVAEKGMELFLDALLPILESEEVEAQIWGLWSMGRACPVSTALTERVRKLPAELQARIDLQPFREDMDAFFAAVDVVVVPSLYPEPFGRMAIEAMAWSLPTVAAAHGGLVEIIEAEKNGLLFTPGSVEELRAALLRIVRDPALRNALGTAARADAERRFSPHAHDENVQAVYEKVLRG